jgi:putative PIN family toxin of toxin-antitoxin system
MTAKRHRVGVVLNTNVWVGNFLARRKTESNNRQVVRLWLTRRALWLILSPDLADEYLDVFEEVLNLSHRSLDGWRKRLADGRRVKVVNLGQRYGFSRDPDDNLLLATAAAGKAKFLVTNDKDLLDLPPTVKRQFKFKIVTPEEFLHWFEKNMGG